MPSRPSAIQLLETHGLESIARHVQEWRNASGGTGGWDAHLKGHSAAARTLLWPEERKPSHSGKRPVPAEASGRPEHEGEPDGLQTLRLDGDRAPDFDAYLMIDWSSRNVASSGSDSIWSALLWWDDGVARVETQNHRTRHALGNRVRELLDGNLLRKRVLLGFDFPLGYPVGFAAALGHAGAAADAWRTVWGRLDRDVRDHEDNANNRFEVAAALNAEVTGSLGPFFGRPPSSPPAIARTLSTKQKGMFAYPLTTRRGPSLRRERATDRRGAAASSPWFVYGGSNSVGGQALVGIPYVSKLRAERGDARVWPFETGPGLPSRSEARIVLAEIYPSLFHTRDRGSAHVHDRLQVCATALAIARHDAAGTLGDLFAAPVGDEGAIFEEGWILGVR